MTRAAMTLFIAVILCVTAAASAAETRKAAAKPRTVTLDVKDEDVRVILRSMKEQCGVRNLLIDKEVQGKGMVYFTEVPCATAFRIVMRQFGLAIENDPNVTLVEKRPH